MKAAAALGIAMIIPGTAQPREKAGCGPHHLTVYLSGDEIIPRHVEVAAEAMATRMFAEPDVRVSWKTADRKSATRPGRHMFVTFTDDTKGFTSNAWALAKSDEGEEIKILRSRLKWGSADPKMFTGLLAHMLVHEITHNLQGVTWHAKTGVMKAAWKRQDLSEMAMRPLGFEPADLILIRNGIEYGGYVVVGAEAGNDGRITGTPGVDAQAAYKQTIIQVRGGGESSAGSWCIRRNRY
jgi:hypothetical protein